MGKLTEHSQAVFDRMLAEAELDDGTLMWKGSLSVLVAELAPPSQYSNILKVLKGAGLIVQVRRGGGGSPSWWAIMDTENTVLVNHPPNMMGTLERRRTLETRIEDLERLVGGVDVPRALADILGARTEGGTDAD